MTEADRCLQVATDESLEDKPPTLACWRLSHELILKTLQQFSSKTDWNSACTDEKEALEEVLALFRDLNRSMSRQDVLVWPDDMKRKPGENELPVVFGGKYAEQPNSISEKLVDLLSESCRKVYTVSRSNRSSAPSHVIHVAKQNLKEPGGAVEFQEVLELVQKDWKDGETLVLYFTLGQHTGSGAFLKNIQAATNFTEALQKVDCNGRPFRVVITGTDATLPSTHPDSTVTIDSVEYTVPSYRIFKYNFVYAMSKLCQYYMIANAIVKMTGATDEAVQNLQEPIDKMTTHIRKAGDDFMLHEDATDGVVTLEQLNAISAKWPSIEDALPQVMVAKDISICYTLLHAEPWTKNAFTKSEAESNGSPRAYMIQQIVRRTRNAISSEKAARAHFPPITSTATSSN